MDEKVRDRVNVLNSLKYRSVQKQKRLEELQTSYNQMEKDASDAVATDAGDSEDSQVRGHSWRRPEPLSSRHV